MECTGGASNPDLSPNSVNYRRHEDVGLVVEFFFSGSCRLSKACRKLGLRALSIDKGPKIWWSQTTADSDAGKRQLFTGQPRIKTFLQPVSEFGHFVTVAIPINCDDLHTVIASLQKGSQPTSRTVQRGFLQGCLQSK